MEGKTRKKIVRIGVGSIAFIGLLMTGFYLYLIRYPQGIQVPLNKEIGFSEFEFEAEEGAEFHLPTGTHITIPANAVVNEEGVRAKGTIKLKFREYHTAEEIFLSGIPMQMPGEREMYMQSDGMMELRLEQSGTALGIAPESELSVDLASYSNVGEDFRLYFLTDDKEWDDGIQFETVQNFRRDTALANLPEPPMTPFDPVPGEDDKTFTLRFNARTMPHLNAWNNTTFKFTKHLSGLEYEQAFRLDWDRLKISESDEKGFLNFNFSFSSLDAKNQLVKHNCSFLAKPLLSGTELEKAIAQFREDMDLYAETMEKIEAERQRIDQEAILLSRFTIAQVGIFNIDYLDRMDAVTVELKFDFEKEINPLINNIMLHVILEDRNSVVKYNFSDWDKIPAINEVVSLAAVLPDGTVAYINPAEYKKKVAVHANSKGIQHVISLKTERIENDVFFNKCIMKSPVSSVSVPRII
jgi:hypothetical protein